MQKMKMLDDARSTLEKFTCTDWKIARDNYLSVDNHMTKGDRAVFPISVTDATVHEVLEGFSRAWRCLKKYKLGEDPDDVDKARRRMKW